MRIRGFMKTRLLLFLSPLFIFTAVAAQLSKLPDAPPLVILAVSPKMQEMQVRLEHKFFDKQNVALFTVTALMMTGDAITTQRVIYPGGCGNRYIDCGEADPLARPLVSKGWSGQLAASAISYGAVMGTAYLFHRTGHHRMERISIWSIIGIEGSMTAWNARLTAR
jgi:hypothetical protein